MSKDKTGAGMGIARQERDCRELAERLGWTVVEVFADNDLSAFSGRPRPQYQAMVEAIKAGGVDALICWHEDRLHRSPRELEDFIDVCEPARVPTMFVQSGELDLTTASGRLTARIRGAVARQESEHKSERHKRAQLQAAEQGRWRGGAKPYGWDVAHDGTATLNAVEAAVIREATAAILAGRTVGSVVATLNRDGMTTRAGKPFTYATLRNMIRRPINAGLSTLHGQVMGPSIWPPIVTEDAWRGACAVLEERRSKRPIRSNRARWLASNIAVCGKDGCGAPMRISVSQNGHGGHRSVYRCGAALDRQFGKDAGSRGHVSRDAAAVDEVVAEFVLSALESEDWDWHELAKTAEPDQGGELRQAAEAARARLAEIADMYAAGRISFEKWSSLDERVSAQLVEIESRMARVIQASALADFVGKDPRTVWEDLDVDRRRAVIREVATVTILPTARGKDFDPASVDLALKVGIRR